MCSNQLSYVATEGREAYPKGEGDSSKGKDREAVADQSSTEGILYWNPLYVFSMAAAKLGILNRNV